MQGSVTRGYTLVHTSPAFVPVNGLSVTNALGTFVVDVVRRVRLFVPSAKSLSSPHSVAQRGTETGDDPTERYRERRRPQRRELRA